MEKLQNLRIGLRLELGFGMILALILCASLAAIFQFNKIDNLHEHMLDHDWVQSDLSNYINIVTRENALRTMELLITEDKSSQIQITATINRNKKLVNTALDKLSTLVQSSNDRTLLETLIQRRNHYVLSFIHVADLITQGQSLQATALLKSETLPAIEALQNSISALAEFHKENVSSHNAQIRHHIQQSLYQIFVLTVIALLLGVIAARLINRSIIRPIEQALHLAEKITHGDLSGGVEVIGSDEMSQLLQAMLKMNNSLVSFRLHEVLNSSVDAAVQIDVRGRITGWNAQAELCFGWTQEEAVGRNVHDLIIPQRYRHAHLQGIESHLSSGQSKMLNTRMEVLALHHDGHEFPAELAVTSIQTADGAGFMAFIRDITDRYRAEAESRIAAIAFESLEGMVVTDALGIILKVNDAFTKITGYEKEDIIGKQSIMFRVHSSSSSHFIAPREHLSKHRFWQGEVSDRRKNGEVYPAWLSISAVVGRDELVTHYIIAFIDNTENKQFQEKIFGLSFTDSLTGLPNRQALYDRLVKILAVSERKRDFGAILVVDLDNFKSFNDARGREHGDRIIQQVVNRINAILHADDLIARVEGDSFAIVISGVDAPSHHSASKARQLAESIRIALSDTFEMETYNYRISCSVGICLFNGNETSPEILIEHAEAAMYKAKHEGRNCIRFYDPATQAALEHRFNLIDWLHKALPDELLLYFQPQVDKDGNPVGAETLIRWQHPVMGLIPPAMFIPLAEETGLILPIGAWVINAACQQLTLWANDPAMCHLKLAVNVSAKQFLQADFANLVLDSIDRSGANPHLLKLELTESMLVSDADSVIEKMLRLKRHGVSFSLDDFGTGYSSLAYLKRLPLDQLKIDQSFIRNLLQDSNDKAIVCAVINMGQSLGLEVIAEGVETKEQRDALVSYGCHHFQGYLFGRPQPIDRFESNIRNQYQELLS